MYWLQKGMVQTPKNADHQKVWSIKNAGVKKRNIIKDTGIIEQPNNKRNNTYTLLYFCGHLVLYIHICMYVYILKKYIYTYIHIYMCMYK
jgi:hypothetical protein